VGPLQFVLFDLDGVLVDSRVPIARSMNFALRQEGLALEPEEHLHRWIGPPLHAGFRALLGARNADLERVDACIAHYREHYREASLEQTEPMPGMGELLEALAPLPLGVATSKPEAFARPILERLGWDRTFRVVVGPPLAGSHLEHKAQTVARARAALGMETAHGAMVGDRAIDVEAGRHNGLLTIAVTWGIGSLDELQAATPTHLVSATPEMGTLLEKLTSDLRGSAGTLL
jgi:phosphoglycolate phosphatase